MRPTEVADEAVIAAGKALLEEGRTVTGYALRKKLGVGAGGRLAAVWSAHLLTQQAALANPPELPMEVATQLEAVTKELTDRLVALARGMNDKAVNAAERRVTDLVRAVEEKTQQAEREVADADLAVGELESALEQARSLHAELDSTHQDVLAQGRAKDVELARVQERHAADTQELERLRAQLLEMTDARSRADQEAATAKDAAASAREEAAGLRGEIRSLQQQNEQLLQKLGKD